MHKVVFEGVYGQLDLFTTEDTIFGINYEVGKRDSEIDDFLDWNFAVFEKNLHNVFVSQF